MKTVTANLLLTLVALIFGNQSLRAQDAVPDGAEPIVASIDVAALKYDYLVDGDLEKDDPAAKKFKTLQAAYAAAPAGTEAKPTVIGIKPNVYQLPGPVRGASLPVEKDWITFLGLTNNRRSVVLADNRGLRQGSDDDGFIVDVSADGFGAKNLTIVNYCNNDYAYPGDAKKNLTRRSSVITQGVALQAAGEKHVYENVALLGRLDTMFLRTTRSYFKHCYVEGTDDWMGGGQVSVWEDCTLVYPEGRGVMSASGVVFMHCKFEATQGMQFYKPEFGSANRPVALIECTMPVSSPEAPVAWFRGMARTRLNQLSLTYHCKDTAGGAAKIYDGTIGTPAFECGREMNDAESRAFNPWNLLRAAPRAINRAQGPLGAFGATNNDAAPPPPPPAPDDWDPAGVKDKYKDAGDLPLQVALTGGTQTIRTGGATATIGASVAPARADQTVAWSTDSPLVSLNAASGAELVVTGQNKTEEAGWAAIKASAANGLYALAYVRVEPKFIDPPAFTAKPTLGEPKDGAVAVEYALDLGGREDQSLVTWFICDDATGKNARTVAVSRGREPLKTLPLTPGYVGKYLEAMVQPRHRISDPGPEAHAFSARAIAAADVTSQEVSPKFRNFPADAKEEYVSGLWTVIGNWRVVPADEDSSGGGTGAGGGGGGGGGAPLIVTPDKLENGYGIRPAGPGFLLYQNDADAGDMQIDLTMAPEKQNTVFSVPGSPADEGPNNLHGDIFFKFDPRTRNGYSLRFWRTAQSARKCMFQFYKIAEGKGTPLGETQVLTGVMKVTTRMTIKVEGNKVTATAGNDNPNDVANDTANGAPENAKQTLTLEGTIEPNRFGGAGVFYPRGSSIIFSKIAISYPKADVGK